MAEVLITLTIIGVIAAITIPNLMQKWSDHADVVKVKENYSILDNALKIMYQENGNPEDWTWPTTGKADYLLDIISPYLKFSQKCGSSYGCTINSTSIYKGLNGGTGGYYATSGKAILANGTTMNIFIERTNNNFGGYFRIDINNNKGPNRFGYDVFFLYFNNKGLTTEEGSWWLNDYCHKPLTTNTLYDGMSCSRWIIHKGNMDYKYRDVSGEWPKLYQK